MNPKFATHKSKIKFIEERIRASLYFMPFFVLTETHWKDYIFDAEININKYNVHRADRVKRKNGGAAIYTHESIAINEEAVYSDSKCESIMLKNDEANIILIGVYKPPKAIALDISFKKCLQSMNDFIEKHNSNSTIIIMGDFNLPIIQWSSGELKNVRSTEDRVCAEALLNFMDKNLLLQQVNETTRDDKSTLDLILTNNEDWLHDITVEKTLISDHDIVNVSLVNLFSNVSDDSEQYIPEQPIDELNFNKANWEKIRQDLSIIDWDEILGQEHSVDTMVEIFESQVLNISKKHTPKSQCKSQ